MLMGSAIDDILSAAERSDLTKHEAVIGRGVRAFVEVGVSLGAVRARRLYRGTHRTFEEYCADRWNISRARAYELMTSADVCLAMPDIPITNARQATELAKVDEDKRREVVEAAQEAHPKGVLTAAGIQQQARGVAPEAPQISDRDSYSTPESYAAVARAALGGRIVLDPASNAAAQNVIQAERWYSKEQNGLAQEWKAETVWMNPPYSQPLCSEFVDKLIGSFQAMDVLQAVTLVNTASETRWWQALARIATLIAFPPRRIQFWHPEGAASDSNRYAQTFFYLGREPALAHKAMRDEAATQKQGEWVFVGRLQ